MNAITRSVGALDTPVDAALTAHEGRDAYLAENGFSLAAYDDAWVQLSFFSLSITVPNPPSRRRAVRLHDLHHVATGYGTDLVGEAEVSAWARCVSGCMSSLRVRPLTAAAFIRLRRRTRHRCHCRIASLSKPPASAPQLGQDGWRRFVRRVAQRVSRSSDNFSATCASLRLRNGTTKGASYCAQLTPPSTWYLMFAPKSFRSSDLACCIASSSLLPLYR